LKAYLNKESRTANTGFSSGGVTSKRAVLCFETRPNAKPEIVKCKKINNEMMKKFFIKVLMITTILSCNEANNKTNATQDDVRNEIHSLQDMPTNHINAWSDGCGFSFELGNDSIWAFGDKYIKYERLNDSIFNIIYPNKPMVIKDAEIEFYEKSRYISFSNSGLTCCLDKNKNEIIFGADRLKFQKLSNNSIKVYFPLQSRWTISRVSDREIYIYNERNRTKYTQFED
jgi:hypothetical protein